MEGGGGDREDNVLRCLRLNVMTFEVENELS